jgi:hypothetical protein
MNFFMIVNIFCTKTELKLYGEYLHCSNCFNKTFAIYQVLCICGHCFVFSNHLILDQMFIDNTCCNFPGFK